MPTGYTSDISKGISFKKFALTCARAFGALYSMRDEPMDADIPVKFEVEKFYYDWVEDGKRDVLRIESMTEKECRVAAKADYDKEIRYRENAIAEANALRMKYEIMLAEAYSWIPPSRDHMELKDFMIKQIKESIEWDCSTEYYEKDVPSLKPWDQWQREALIAARRSLANHEESLNKAITSAESRTKWVRQLIDSLPKE
jgi:hypothetical protein